MQKSIVKTAEENELASIMKIINDSAEGGGRITSYYEAISEATREKLQELGYEIVHEPEINSYTISW